MRTKESDLSSTLACRLNLACHLHLVVRLAKSCRITMKQVVISDLKEGTFYADITLVHNGKPFSIDARPSDAIGLAVRTGVSIFSDEHVLNEASVFIQTEDEDEIERFRDFLKDVKPEDFM